MRICSFPTPYYLGFEEWSERLSSLGGIDATSSLRLRITVSEEGFIVLVQFRDDLDVIAVNKIVS